MIDQIEFEVMVERDEEGYCVATVPALRGCHTQAENLKSLDKRVQEIIQLCAEGMDGSTRARSDNR
jgi:predicted RNase H-like HicB family nuclease